MTRRALWLLLLLACPLAGCGESAEQANRNQAEADQKAIRALHNATVHSAVTGLEAQIAKVEHQDAQASLTAEEAGRPAPAPHHAEIRRLRSYIRRARGEEPYPVTGREGRERQELREAEAIGG